jgi:hypothetical protein
MKKQLYIPKKLNVGFQLRKGTYTGKLAYVIYWDDKGKLRKETSWESWRQKPGQTSVERLYTEDNGWTQNETILGDDIKAQVLDNVPTEGFVLNKGVGGARQSYGWNARNEYIRVYDPRGFEFEISVANLLFILQECTSTKGKGLEGEFVYSWEGKELVLLPVNSLDYKESTNYTALQSKKVGRADMTPGCTYTMKDDRKLIYLGRLPYHEFKYDRSTNSGFNKKLYINKSHVFVDVNFDENGYGSKYVIQKGFTKLATKDSETPVPNYADLLEEFSNSKFGSKINNFSFKKVPLDFDNKPFRSTYIYDGTNGEVNKYYINKTYNRGFWGDKEIKGYEVKLHEHYKIVDGVLLNKYLYNNNVYMGGKQYRTMEEILALPSYECSVELESGYKVELEKY